ncbi:hypothetical protein [Pseudomonas viridiflava]|uniref:hypothetical protein n=1 Tax=Pseudomonas viridiflava TaxID=33069 RepID=UPI0018E5F9B6|nr:hypothetical protein [Pseudomonas viridiflava]MBI6704826.1 hypothetical protein [Pseudomonas viridiflava]MBI6723078.1 hypothetical protein [Pseudomonas viridiflava]
MNKLLALSCLVAILAGCGADRAVEDVGKIVGGEPAPSGQYPFFARMASTSAVVR